MARFRQWVAGLPANQRPTGVEPWLAIPQMLKMSMLGWNADYAAEEQRLSDMSSFESLDELGRFLEWSLHGFLHNAASNMFGEPVLLGFESPRSTYFWQLHGLIDHLRQQWVDNDQGEEPSPLFSPMQVDGPEVQAAIGQPGEIDRYAFTLTNTTQLSVATSGPSDTVIYIAGPNNPQRLHSVNDDSPDGFNARVEEQFSPGTYFVYVVFYDRSDTGSYAISVQS